MPGSVGIVWRPLRDGENPLDCIIRELQEELELRIRAPKVKKIFRHDEVLEYAFEYEISPDINELDLHEGLEMNFFVSNGLPEKIVPWHLPLLKGFFEEYNSGN